MTTPERGLFEQIRGLLPITGCFTNIEKICVEHEQRLTEAEKELAARQIWENAHSIAALEQRLLEAEKERDRMLNIIGAKEDERMEAHRQATQLRARCGELENIAHKANAVNEHWNEFGHEHGFDERMDHLHAALTAAPQPADDQFENRPRVMGGKTVDRWYVRGSGAMAPFWPTIDGAREANATPQPAQEKYPDDFDPRDCTALHEKRIAQEQTTK